MHKIYIFNNWHNGDVLTNRCLIKALLNYDLHIAVGSYKNRHYLVGDLPVEHIVAPWDEDSPRSPCLSQLCPIDYTPINSWCGTFRDIDIQGYHNWSTIVKTWNRHSDIYGLDVHLSFKEVPMLDFEYPCTIKTRGRSVYVETGKPRSEHCAFDFDMNKLGKLFPDFNFYCTSKVDCMLLNVISCNNRSLVELSFISNGCEAIIGNGSGPFLCTYTEANRKKPRAVVDFTAPPFWAYRNNPLKYLHGEQAIIDFLAQVYQNPLEVL